MSGCPSGVAAARNEYCGQRRSRVTPSIRVTTGRWAWKSTCTCSSMVANSVARYRPASQSAASVAASAASFHPVNAAITTGSWSTGSWSHRSELIRRWYVPGPSTVHAQVLRAGGIAVPGDDRLGPRCEERDQFLGPVPEAVEDRSGRLVGGAFDVLPKLLALGGERTVGDQVARFEPFVGGVDVLLAPPTGEHVRARRD